MEKQFKKHTQCDCNCEHYVAPSIEVIELEVEGAVMQTSSPGYGDGGGNDF